MFQIFIQLIHQFFQEKQFSFEILKNFRFPDVVACLQNILLF